MGIFLIIIAIVFFVSILLIFRMFDTYKIDNSQALIFNYFVAAFFAFTIYSGELKIVEIPSQDWFSPSIILGVLFALSFLLFALSTQKAGIAITSVASKMAVMIPVIFGAYFYDSENLNAIKIIGLLLAMASFLLIFKKNNTESFNKNKILLPIAIFVFSGANDTLLKFIREVHFNISESDLNSEILFVATLFSISFISSLIFFGIPLIVKKKKFELKNIIAGSILGIFNFLSAFTMFKAMGYFESSIFFPIFNVSVVGLSALIGVVLFKEKLTTINYIGLILALAAILLLTL